MIKKVTIKQKKEILNNFLKGCSLKELSSKYSFSVQTISRQLRTVLDESQFKKIKSENSLNKKVDSLSNIINSNQEMEIEAKSFKNKIKSKQENASKLFEIQSSFVEIAPLKEVTNFDEQKEISSRPISEIKFPKVVYLLVDKNIELEYKLLKEYSEWSFLPEKDLNRRALKIFDEQKNAKLNCHKNNKLIKVPNPNVFFIVSDILRSKGISRIIFQNCLYSV